MKIIAITQARMSSTRLPGKVLKEVQGQTLLKIHMDRVAPSKLVNKHIVAISDVAADDQLEAYCRQQQYYCFRGSENDVLDRFYQAAKPHQPDVVVRLTADCPLIDAAVIDAVIGLHLSQPLDYTSNILDPSFPDGLDVEVFSFQALEQAWNAAELPSEREHVTPYIWRNSTAKGKNLFKSANLTGQVDCSEYRLTVDEKEDLLLIEQLIAKLGTKLPWTDYVEEIKRSKLDVNTKYTRNEGYTNSLKKDNT